MKGLDYRFSSRFLVRVSALPVGVAPDLRLQTCRGILDGIVELDHLLQQSRDSISDTLYAVIGSSASKKERHAAIALRRELYALRLPVAGTAVSRQLKTLTQSNQEIAAFVEMLRRRDSLAHDLATKFEEERYVARRRLCELTALPFLQRGLFVGSESLFAAQSGYVTAPPRGQLSGRMARVERGLLRYVLRASMKATPFSSFCAVVRGRFWDASRDDEQAQFQGQLYPLVPSTRLNKKLFSFWTARLASRLEVKRVLQLAINPTMRSVEPGFHFLAGNGVHEVFQRISANAVLELLFDEVQSVGGLRFGDFVDLIAGHPEIECSVDEAHSYATKLLEIGAVRLSFGVPEREAIWAPTLAQVLQQVPGHGAAEFAESLRRLDECTVAMQQSALVEYVRLASEVKRISAAVSSALGVESVSPPFHEDCTANLDLVVPRTRAIEKLERDMGKLLAAGLRISWPRPRQAELRHFFDTQYAEQQEVRLLDFYETFYRKHFKEHLRLSEQATRASATEPNAYDEENPFGLEIVNEIRAARMRLSRLITGRWEESPDAAEICFTIDEIEAVTSNVPWTSRRPSSNSVLGSLVLRDPSSSEYSFVCRQWQTGVGHGRMFSRWLHMLGRDILEEVRQENAAVAGDVRFAEIVSDGGHNANLHPPLLPWDLEYPNTEGGGGDTSLNPTDIVVERDLEDSYSLCLRHSPSGRPVVPVDLGFLAQHARPPLYQLLASFAPPSGIPFPVPYPVTRHGEGTGLAAGVRSDVTCIPRVRVEGIVTSRRKWLVPHSSLPKALPSEEDWRYAIRLNAWRLDRGLPSECYLRYRTPPGSDAVRNAGGADVELPSMPTKKKAFRSRLNEQKPQYIDFFNALTISLMRHEAVAQRPVQMVFEERYPVEEQLPPVQGQRHAVEMIIQLVSRP